MQTQKPPRPKGVTVIAILAILVGVVLLITGAGVFSLPSLFTRAGLLGGLVSNSGKIVAGVLFFFGFIWLFAGWGFLMGRRWAWTLGLIFSILSMLGNIAYLATGGPLTGVAGLVILSLIIYYLMERRVKAFFGKGLAIVPASYTTTPATPATRPSVSPASMLGSSLAGSIGSGSVSTVSNRFCTNCGAAAIPGVAKCSQCGAPL